METVDKQKEFIPNNAQNTSKFATKFVSCIFCLYVHKECLANQWRFWSKKFVTLYTKGMFVINIRTNEYINK